VFVTGLDVLVGGLLVAGAVVVREVSGWQWWVSGSSPS
jgi:hypothetical protein